MPGLSHDTARGNERLLLFRLRYADRSQPTARARATVRIATARAAGTAIAKATDEIP